MDGLNVFILRIKGEQLGVMYIVESKSAYQGMLWQFCSKYKTDD